MTADDVDAFLGLMDTLGVRVWLDGGWAVDACLGAPTRRHGDLDIVIEERDVAAVVSALQARAYAPVARADTRPWNFVMADDAGRQIDFHVVVLDEQGHGAYGPPHDAGATALRRWLEQAPSKAAEYRASHRSGWPASTRATTSTKPTGRTCQPSARGSAFPSRRTTSASR